MSTGTLFSLRNFSWPNSFFRNFCNCKEVEKNNENYILHKVQLQNLESITQYNKITSKIVTILISRKNQIFTYYEEKIRLEN